ncbi:MAG: hypothetical protein ABWX57_00560 [Aeromicrobium sp.]
MTSSCTVRASGTLGSVRWSSTPDSSIHAPQRVPLLTEQLPAGHHGEGA